MTAYLIGICLTSLMAAFCFGAMWGNTRQKRAKSLPKQVFDEIEEMTGLSEKPHHGMNNTQ